MKLTDINSNNFATRQEAIEELKTELQKYRDNASTEECESLLAEIKECLFYDGESEGKAEKFANMMNTNLNIPDSAIDEFEKDPAGTIEKYSRYEI